MISVMTAKWVGDAFGKDGGIYAVWIAMRGYPWLPPTNFRDNGETGTQLMQPLERLVVIEDEQETVADLGAQSAVEISSLRIFFLDTLLNDHNFHGFPVVRRQEFLGFVTRDKLRIALGELCDARMPLC